MAEKYDGMSSRPVIHVEALTKAYRTYVKAPGFWGAVRGIYQRRYQETIAANAVSFSVQPGELVGFLGPNGAGKTTVLKMLSGLIYPTSGKATVLGHTPSARQDVFRRQFALVMGQKNQLWWDLPASESLELNRVVYGISLEDARKTIDSLGSALGVTDKLGVMVRELSLGERMKFELIAALLHKPKVLFLDEPTIGLDVISQKTVREFLKEYGRRETITTLLTSHYMQDIEELCERVIIIDHGKVFFDGPLQSVVDRFSSHKRLTLHRKTGFEKAPEQAGVPIVDRGTDFLKFNVDRKEIVPVSQRLMGLFEPDDITVEEVPIEEVIRDVFSKHREDLLAA